MMTTSGSSGSALYELYELSVVPGNAENLGARREATDPLHEARYRLLRRQHAVDAAREERERCRLEVEHFRTEVKRCRAEVKRCQRGAAWFERHHAELVNKLDDCGSFAPENAAEMIADSLAKLVTFYEANDEAQRNFEKAVDEMLLAEAPWREAKRRVARLESREAMLRRWGSAA
jgi:chromosome segregation ATPase